MEAKREEKPARPKSRQSIAHVPSRSNTTTDIAALKRANDVQTKSKRSRGKSIGPGGLEALTETNANALKVAPAFQPRSILKTSVPLTPPKVIPSFDDLRKKGTTKGKSPTKVVSEDLLIDFSTPAPSRDVLPNSSVPGAALMADPFSPIARQHSARPATSNGDETRDSENNDDTEQLRKAARKADMDKRAARRKSLANRRVSFAPEATLHTWSVMELLEDSTTSSASNSTKRQSSVPNTQSPAAQIDALVSSDILDRPTTPVEQHNDEVVPGTPESQRNLHQRKRRRSSDNLRSSDDEAMSSPGDGGDSSPIRVEDSIDSESDTDGDTAMSLDEMTSNTLRSSDSSSTQTSLDERLRQAATQAGTRGIQHDESLSADEDDQPMEIADGTVTHAFRQYGPQKSTQWQDEQDKENIDHSTNGHSSLEQYESDADQEESTMGLTMDMTRAVGGIVSRDAGSQSYKPQGRRKSHVSRRVSSGDDTSYGDETMDLTVAKGGILTNSRRDLDENEALSDGDMTMEMTKVVGGLRHPGPRKSLQPQPADDTESMDMTMAAGMILEPIEEQTETQMDIDENFTGAMDITRAVGKILVQQPPDHERAFQNIKDEDLPTPSDQLNQELSLVMAAPSSAGRQMTTITSETGSPTLKPRHSARRPTSRTPSSLPGTRAERLSPETKVQTTPSKQLTPMPAKSTSPQRTPVLPASVAQRGVSPKKLFAKELRERASPAARKSPRKQQDMLFSKDENTGLQTPRVVLHAPKPHQHLRRKSNATLVEEQDIGSPRVSEILSRRTSITDIVPAFQFYQGHKRNLRFEDPVEMANEIDAERVEEHRRESGRFIMEQESDQQQDENTTHNLRDMIESMTPRKENPTKLKGRKSLAVGSAKGLLGKRPAELDNDQDNDVDGESTPKRLKTVSREGSPVKKVHLPKPPTKEQTTGRLTQAEKLGLAAMAEASNTPTLARSPSRDIRSPDHTGHFKTPTSHQKPQSFETRLDNVMGATDVSTTHPDLVDDVEEEKISLQQFLTMTNIHFIELSTTKRRNTIAPVMDNADVATAVDGTSKAIFVAAATTLPVLELYQHASKELKSYISSGRKIIRTIETETLADQPAIFRRYVDARPDQKAIMENQFRNAKTNARLQSKEGWYSWRGQLVDGLRSGLQGFKENMEKDECILSEQQTSLEDILPRYNARKEELERELVYLSKRLSDFERVDHETLETKRQELANTDQEVSTQSALLAHLEHQKEEKEEVLSQATELRQEMNDQINEAVRVQEEQLRWHSKDVAASKSRVETMERESGWKLLTAEEDIEEPNDLGVALTLRYMDQLRLFFYPSAFQPKSDSGRRRSGRKSRSVSGPSAPISLTYAPAEDDTTHTTELSTELRFFLQLIQGQLHSFAMMPKGTIGCQNVLKTVSHGWSLAKEVAEEIRQLNAAGIVNVSIRGDEKLSAKLMVMQPDRSRVDFDFTLTALPLNDGEISISTAVTAAPTYGTTASLMDTSKIRKVQHALSKEVESKKLGEGSWISAMRGFEQWLQLQALAKKEANKPKAATHSSTIPQPKSQEQSNNHQAVRACTQSPDKQNNLQVSTTPKGPPRSPLAPRTTNTRIQKKALPVPKKPVNFSTSQSQSQFQDPSTFSTSIIGREASQQKENLVPADAVASKTNGDVLNGFGNANLIIEDDVFGGARPAITPEMQEAMMHTPMKRRVGKLRRSPI